MRLFAAIFLFDLADDVAIAWEALETIRFRLPKPIILVPPTVIDGLVVAHDNPNDTEEKRLAVTRSAARGGRLTPRGPCKKK